MRVGKLARSLFISVLVLVGAHACAEQVTGGDSESHFVKCATDERCKSVGAEYECVRGFCHVPGDAGAQSTIQPQSDVDGAITKNGCEHKRPPARASSPDPGGSHEIVVAQSNADLGDDSSIMVMDRVRYQTLGFDLDGVCTTTPSGPKTCAPPSSGLLLDGPGGTDNAFGSFFQQLRDLLGTDYSSDTYTRSLSAGAGSNLLLRVTNYNGTFNDDHVQVEFFSAGRFDASLTPAWDGNDVFPIDGRSVVDGDVQNPTYVDVDGYVADNVLVASLSGLSFAFAPTDSSGVLGSFDVHLQNAFLKCSLVISTAGRWGYALKACTLAGLSNADELLHQLSRFQDPVDFTTLTALCRDATAYPAFKQALCSVRDTSSVGVSTSPCDSLSFALTFDTEPAVLGDLYTSPPVDMRCSPEVDPVKDTCAGPPFGTDGG